MSRAGSRAAPARCWVSRVGLQPVARRGGAGEEAVRVEVLHWIRWASTTASVPACAQPQRHRVARLAVLGAVEHGPLVQPEAAELRRAAGRRRQQAGDPADGDPALGQERVDVDRDPARRLRVERPAQPARAALPGEHRADAGVPAAQPVRGLGVVGEEEVPDRVGHARRGAAAGAGGPRRRPGPGGRPPAPSTPPRRGRSSGRRAAAPHQVRRALRPQTLPGRATESSRWASSSVTRTVSFSPPSPALSPVWPSMRFSSASAVSGDSP